MKTMNKMLSYKSIEPHLKYLRMCGYYQIDPGSPKKHILIHAVYMRLILFLILLYATQQLLRVYQVRGDINKVMATLFLFLTHSDSIYKQIVFWRKADKIEEIIQYMKDPVFNESSPQKDELLKQTVKQARFILRAFNYAALFTCFLWVVYPIVLHVQGKTVEFAIWLPFETKTNRNFYIAAIYVWVQTSWLAFNNTTMDILLSFFLGQCKTQLSILRLDLETLPERSKEEAMRLSKPFSEVFHKNFVQILMHYDKIVQFARKIQETFGGPILYQFIVGAWVICTTAYKTVNMTEITAEIVSNIMYMLCILTEPFVFCYYGNDVYYESGLLMTSAYAMNWLEVPIKNRKDLLIFMERIKRPIRPTAGVIVPLSNSTFITVLRTAYSFYALLKNI